FILSMIVSLCSQLILDLPVPEFLTGLLGALRSSGRMFWPAAYMLLAWSIMMLDRLPSRKFAGSTLAIAMVLQVADTSVVRRTLVETYQPKPPPDLDLRPLVGVASLKFVPAYSCTEVNRPAMRQIALAT